MMKIIHFSADNWQRARDIRLRALRDSPDAFGATLEHSTSMSAERWRDRLGSTGAATFVAVVDENDVGMAVGAEYEGEGAGLFGMWVAPEARGMGVGDALVQVVIKWASSNDYRRLVLDVGEWNEKATSLYLRNGFEPTGVEGTLPPPRTHIRERQLAIALGVVLP